MDTEGFNFEDFFDDPEPFSSPEPTEPEEPDRPMYEAPPREDSDGSNVGADAEEENTVDNTESTEKKYFSTTVALEKLDAEIQKLSNEVKELGNSIKSFNGVRQQLIKEYGKKQAILASLQAKREELARAEGSYMLKERASGDNLTLGDKRLTKLEGKITELNEKRAGVSPSSKKIIIKAKAKELDRKIKRLQAKKGRIEKKQRKIVNIRLAFELAQIKKAAKQEGKIAAFEMIKDEYADRAEQFADRSTELSDNGSRTVISAIPQLISMINTMRSERFREKMEKLEHKTGELHGGSTLPDRLKNIVTLFQKKPQIHPTPSELGFTEEEFDFYSSEENINRGR